MFLTRSGASEASLPPSPGAGLCILCVMWIISLPSPKLQWLQRTKSTYVVQPWCVQITVCLSSISFHLHPLKCEHHKAPVLTTKSDLISSASDEILTSSWSLGADLPGSIISWGGAVCETGGMRVIPDCATLRTRNHCVSGPANREPQRQLRSLSHFPDGKRLQLL